MLTVRTVVRGYEKKAPLTTNTDFFTVSTIIVKTVIPKVFGIA